MRKLMFLLLFPILIFGQTEKTLVQDFLDDPRIYTDENCRFLVNNIDKSDGAIIRKHLTYDYKLFNTLEAKIEISFVSQKKWLFGTNLLRIEHLSLRGNHCIKLKHGLKIGDDLKAFTTIFGKENFVKTKNQIYEIVEDVYGIKKKMIIKSDPSEKVIEIELFTI